ncbi:hypothetical protein [Streptomyces sp. 769]|uniref:hypothetical protein n=1 Tax=Streptomyces sp. 769 TaxID=1262452 RepID=UPI00057FD4BE|nr:hypothetical protein [Streptomyces sp. 769]
MTEVCDTQHRLGHEFRERLPPGEPAPPQPQPDEHLGTEQHQHEQFDTEQDSAGYPHPADQTSGEHDLGG